MITASSARRSTCEDPDCEVARAGATAMTAKEIAVDNMILFMT
jgi:hypothetical protein